MLPAFSALDSTFSTGLPFPFIQPFHKEPMKRAKIRRQKAKDSVHTRKRYIQYYDEWVSKFIICKCLFSYKYNGQEMKERALMLSPKGYDLPKFSLQLLNMILSSAFCHSDPKRVILKKKTEKLHTCTYMYLYKKP